MVERFVEKTGSIDKLTRDKLLGDREPLLKRQTYNLFSGDEVRQVKQKPSSGCIVELAKYVGENESSFDLKYYPGLEVAMYCDNDTGSASTREEESGIRQTFTAGSISAHKYHSLSELETIVRQFILRWRQVVRQLQESTLTDSANTDCFSSESGYVHRKGTLTFLSGLGASRLLLVSLNLPFLCLTDEDLQNKLKELKTVRDQSGDLLRKLKEGNDQDERDKSDTSHQIVCVGDLLRKLKEGKDQDERDKSGIPYELPRDPSLEQNNPTSDDMQNMLKKGKDKDIGDLLGIPHKNLRNYSRKQSNSNTGIYELVHKFVLDDPKDILENNNSKSMGRIIVNLLADHPRKYGNLFKEARSTVSQVRKHTDLWHGNVLASRDKELLSEGSFAGNVQKLMKKDLNRLGAGGNGEIVEAFYQKKHLVIKQTLLRELELSVVPKLEHKNLLPWFAIISGEKSERRPGQVSCYQIMPKMTEALSASIRTIGGSTHDHILSLQQDSVPKAAVSQQAELMRRNTSVIFRNVLEGLQYLHEQDLVHRDIKASNILLKKPESCAHTSIFTCDCTPHWEVKVANFDSIGQVSVLRKRAAMRGKELKNSPRPFLKVSATGTSGYRAPEIFEEFTSSDVNDPHYFSPASDIWALGGVGIHAVMGFCTPRKQYQFGLMMLARRGKLKGEERDDIISRTLGLHHIREGFPGEKWKDMINFVSRPLQIDRYQRPSAKELLQDPYIQRYNTTPGVNTVVNETATLDTATPSTIENRFSNRNDISGPNRTSTSSTTLS